MDEERTLVVAAVAGDGEAFDLLAEASRPWLRALCFRLVHDPVAAEDLVQETLLLAFRDLSQLRDPASFRAWLSRIAHNRCQMHRRRLLAEEPLDESRAGAAPQADPPLGLAPALARLGPEDRRLLRLFYGGGLSHAEAARALSVSAPAVKSRLHRARAQLRKEMLAMLTDDEKARLGVSEEAPWELRTILLVESDPEVRRSAHAALVEAGYEVIDLPNGEAAISAVRERRGQLLILDKRCGEPHWLEVVALVHADPWGAKNVPVFMLIYKEPMPEAERDVFLAWHASVAAVLTHPFHTEEVVQFVQKVAGLPPN